MKKILVTAIMALFLCLFFSTLSWAGTIDITIDCEGTPPIEVVSISPETATGTVGDDVKFIASGILASCWDGQATKTVVKFGAPNPWGNIPVEYLAGEPWGDCITPPTTKAGLFKYTVEAQKAGGVILSSIDPYLSISAATPTLTQWGLLILTILVISSGTWLMLKRRRAVRV